MPIKRSSQHFFCKVAIFYLIPDQALHIFFQFEVEWRNTHTGPYRTVQEFCVLQTISWWVEGDRKKEESTTNDDKNLETLLQRCLDYGIILNGDKMEVRNIDVV